MSAHLVADTPAWHSMVTGELATGFDPAVLQAHGADAHWVWLDAQQAPRARCSLWWRQVPSDAPHRLGLIGHFAALDPSAATALLQHALAELRKQSCTRAVGPMDGNTWRRYRLLTERGNEPTFFLEPDNPDTYPGYFEAAGFSPLAHYFSALNDDLTQEDPRLEAAARRFAAHGITLRPLDAGQFDAALDDIYDVSVASFTNNFLYTPIERADFHQQYRKIQAYVDPRLTWIADAQGHAIGYVFGVPDLAQRQRGAAVDTMLVKTVAVRPGRAQAGLGSLLVGHVQRAARDAGYTRAIHALMHDSNRSGNISSRYARPIRRYTLYMQHL